MDSGFFHANDFHFLTIFLRFLRPLQVLCCKANVTYTRVTYSSCGAKSEPVRCHNVADFKHLHGSGTQMSKSEDSTLVWKWIGYSSVGARHRTRVREICAQSPVSAPWHLLGTRGCKSSDKSAEIRPSYNKRFRKGFLLFSNIESISTYIPGISIKKHPLGYERVCLPLHNVQIHLFIPEARFLLRAYERVFTVK